MITYKIIVTNTPSTPKREHVSPDQPTYKEHIFRRLLNSLSFSVGARIQIKGTPRRGHVTKIVKELSDVRWNKNKPEFIQIKMDDGQEYLTHPKTLKRSRK
jgi:uncharacterized protein YlxW (UPF0749 family)